MSKKRNLSAVPDPEPEAEAETPETPPQQAGYTIGDQVRGNARLVAEIMAENDLGDTAAVQLLGLTFNYHLTKIQLGLSAPVEN